jgi:hypothetical protein
VLPSAAFAVQQFAPGEMGGRVTAIDTAIVFEVIIHEDP